MRKKERKVKANLKIQLREAEDYLKKTNKKGHSYLCPLIMIVE
jgi:hypothetical protein